MYSFSRLFSFFFSGKTRPHCIVVYGSNMQGTSYVHSNLGYFKCTIYQCLKLTSEISNNTTKWRAPYIVHYIRDTERFRTQLRAVCHHDSAAGTDVSKLKSAEAHAGPGGRPSFLRKILKNKTVIVFKVINYYN